MTQRCSVCGRECNEKLMEHYFTGIKTEWWCWDCWKKSQYEAVKSEIHRSKRLGKINEERKRYK